ncbi:MAG: Gx transporter family protein [Candidatus Tenebribacter mawsonii]|nr:Gx transporter family protein [Candidatus Tenebribacter mawsonii]
MKDKILPKEQHKLDLSNLRLIHLAFFTAFAIAIYVIESFIPKPFPFMKLGLANMIVLLLLVSGNIRYAFIVIISKTVAGGFFSGLFFSPTTLLSISGSLCSLVVMTIFIKSKIRFSLIGISILGAVAHNMAQITVVRLLIIKENTIFYLTPLLIFMGIVTGIIIGYITKLFLERLTGDYEKRSN